MGNLTGQHYKTYNIMSQNFAMGLVIGLTFLIVLSVVLIILATLPKDVYLDEHENICLKAYLGKPERIPLAEIQVTDMPEGAMRHLIRTFGTSVGKCSSGRFYNTRLKQKFFLFTRGSSEKVCFVYEGRTYIVDSWM